MYTLPTLPLSISFAWVWFTRSNWEEGASVWHRFYFRYHISRFSGWSLLTLCSAAFPWITEGLKKKRTSHFITIQYSSQKFSRRSWLISYYMYNSPHLTRFWHLTVRHYYPRVFKVASPLLLVKWSVPFDSSTTFSMSWVSKCEVYSAGSSSFSTSSFFVPYRAFSLESLKNALFFATLSTPNSYTSLVSISPELSFRDSSVTVLVIQD